MWFYLLYLVGYLLCRILPRKICYWVAYRLADLWCGCSLKDRFAIERNLQVVLKTDSIDPLLVRQVFRYFGMYLVDFFRFDRLNAKGLQRLVRIDGIDRMKSALKAGKGVVGITAHLGNYELAGAVLSQLGLPVTAVMLTHQNPYVDRFFNQQRTHVGVKSIPIQKMTSRDFYREAMASLQRNEILALVADRDYFNHGIPMELFGKSVRIPTGPAFFSWKTQAPLVPAFLVREEDGSYRFIIEAPILPPAHLSREEAIRQMTQEMVEVIAGYVRRYPTQWYMFQEFWKPVPGVTL